MKREIPSGFNDFCYFNLMLFLHSPFIIRFTFVSRDSFELKKIIFFHFKLHSWCFWFWSRGKNSFLSFCRCEGSTVHSNDDDYDDDNDDDALFILSVRFVFELKRFIALVLYSQWKYIYSERRSFGLFKSFCRNLFKILTKFLFTFYLYYSLYTNLK